MRVEKHVKCLPLIKYEVGYGYKMDAGALEFLSGLAEEDSYSVLVMAGRARSGKSFLLNRLVGDEEMFPMSCNLGNCSRGIMLGTKLLNVNGMKVIVLDCEGFGSLQGSQDKDCKLFVLCLLLGSVMIYNSMGTIDQQTLNNFSMIIEVGKMFEKQLETENSMPALFWVLRDFSLQMEDRSGAPMSAKQYLEYALEEQKGNSRAICHKNRIRRVIKELFMERMCETLVLPQEELPSSGGVQGHLRSQFVEDFNRFSNKLFHLIYKKGCKQFNKNRMTITNFINIIQIYLKNINKSVIEGNILKIQNITYQVKQYQINHYKGKFSQFLNEIKKKIVNQIRETIKNNQGFDDFDGVKRKFSEAIDKFYENTRNSVYALAGQVECEQLTELKNGFYQQLERQCSEVAKSCQSSPSSEQEIENICEYISKIADEKKLQHEYALGMRELKDRNIGKRKGVFVNMLMKVEIAYLRRKVELGKEVRLKYEKLCMEYEFMRKELNRVQERNTEMENELIEEIKESRKVLLTPGKQEGGEEVVGRSMVRETALAKKGNLRKASENENYHSSNKGENSSFYSPYVLIQKSQHIVAKIVRTLIKEDSKRNNYIEYVIDVNLLGQKWMVNRKYKDFSELHSILVMMFQNLQLPDCRAINGSLNATDFNISKKEVIEQRRKQLELYLRELMESDSVRNSRILQKFLKINKQYTIL